MSITPDEKRSWLTESVLLAVIPVMAYLLAFGFEYGYYLAYGFPQELIAIDLNRVFAAGTIFLAGVLFVLILTTVVLALLPSKHPLTPAVAQVVPLALAYLAFLNYYDRFDVFAKIFALLLASYLVYKFVVPLLTQRGVSGYVHKYSTQEQIRQARGTLFRTMLRTFGPTPGIILVYFFIAVILSVTFGWHLATQRVCYFVVPDPPERVVLRIYGDSLILARLDRPARQILREYLVLKRTAGAVTLREDCIGPLTVER